MAGMQSGWCHYGPPWCSLGAAPLAPLVPLACFSYFVLQRETRGMSVAGVCLRESIVRAGFEYATREEVPLCGFLGDDCVTLHHTPEIQVGSSALRQNHIHVIDGDSLIEIDEG